MNTRKYRNATTYAADLMATVREDLAARRAAKAAHDQLMRELDSYTSRSDIEDLLAAADRSESPEAEDLRDILNGKLAARSRRHWLAA